MRPSDAKPALGRAATLWLLLAVWACAAPPPAEMSPAARDEYCRLSLERSRVLRAEGDLAGAERALRGVLAVDPGNQRARMMRIGVLEDLGRVEEAERERRLAEALRPEREGPSRAPGEAGWRSIVAIIAGPNLSEGRTLAYVSAMTDPFASELAQRVQARLPQAEVTRQVPASVPEAQAWLSQRQPGAVIGLRARNAFCRESPKDGRFAVAELDAAVGRSGNPEVAHVSVRETVYDPEPGDCELAAVASAVERMLQRVEARRAPETATGGGAEPWRRETVRELFFALDAAIQERLEAGRGAMAGGRFAEALEAFREAEGMDPEDPQVRAHLREAQDTLELHRELKRPPESSDSSTRTSSRAVADRSAPLKP